MSGLTKQRVKIGMNNKAPVHFCTGAMLEYCYLKKVNCSKNELLRKDIEKLYYD